MTTSGCTPDFLGHTAAVKQFQGAVRNLLGELSASLNISRFDFVELTETVAGRLLIDAPDANFELQYELPEQMDMPTIWNTPTLRKAGTPMEKKSLPSYAGLCAGNWFR